MMASSNESNSKCYRDDLIEVNDQPLPSEKERTEYDQLKDVVALHGDDSGGFPENFLDQIPFKEQFLDTVHRLLQSGLLEVPEHEGPNIEPVSMSQETKEECHMEPVPMSEKMDPILKGILMCLEQGEDDIDSMEYAEYILMLHDCVHCNSFVATQLTDSDINRLKKFTLLAPVCSTHESDGDTHESDGDTMKQALYASLCILNSCADRIKKDIYTEMLFHLFKRGIQVEPIWAETPCSHVRLFVDFLRPRDDLWDIVLCYLTCFVGQDYRRGDVAYLLDVLMKQMPRQDCAPKVLQVFECLFREDTLQELGNAHVDYMMQCVVGASASESFGEITACRLARCVPYLVRLAIRSGNKQSKMAVLIMLANVFMNPDSFEEDTNRSIEHFMEHIEGGDILRPVSDMIIKSGNMELISSFSFICRMILSAAPVTVEAASFLWIFTDKLNSSRDKLKIMQKFGEVDDDLLSSFVCDYERTGDTTVVCHVCLYEISPLEKAKTLRNCCPAVGHFHCYLQWLRRSPKCMICKKGVAHDGNRFKNVSPFIC